MTDPVKLQEHITSIIQQYRLLGSSYNNISDLMHMRKNLATISFLFGNEVGKARRQKENATFCRKAAYLNAIKEGMSKYNATQNKLNAESSALYELSEEYKAEGIYHHMKIILDQCNEVLGTMNQHISQLRVEAKQSTHL